MGDPEGPDEAETVVVIVVPGTTTTTALPFSNLVKVTGGAETTSVTKAMSGTVVGMLNCVMMPMMLAAVALDIADPVTLPLATEEEVMGASEVVVAGLPTLSNPEAISMPVAGPAVPTIVDSGRALRVLFSQTGPAKGEGATNALRIGDVAVARNLPEGLDAAVPRYLLETFAIRGMPKPEETTAEAETGRSFETDAEAEYTAVLLTVCSRTGRGVATAEPTAAVPV